MSQLYSKNSFERFGGDLTELILSHLSNAESFLYKCISKQWKRLVFNKIFFINIGIEKNDYEKWKHLLVRLRGNILDLKQFETLLKKCSSIKSISLNPEINYVGFVNREEVFETIIENCNNLVEIPARFFIWNEILMDKFLIKFGGKIKSISYSTEVCVNDELFRIYSRSLTCLKSFRFIYGENTEQINTLLEKNIKSLRVLKVIIVTKGENPDDYNVTLHLENIFERIWKLKKLKHLSIDAFVMGQVFCN